MKPYNGHESWNAWNVALWINNEEPLYRLAMDCANRAPSLRTATNLFLASLGENRTPDGARYSFHSTMLAMKGLRDEIAGRA
jgi:hypothetical protein